MIRRALKHKSKVESWPAARLPDFCRVSILVHMQEQLLPVRDIRGP